MDISALRDRQSSAPLSVSELNNYIKNVFESDRNLVSVSVRGEISNFTNHRSGHLYFSLKDSEGQIRAVMFRSRAMLLKFMPEAGMKVTVHGSVTVYPRDGSYQIYVNSMQPDGIGALYLAYEQLKARLSAEGLFDEAHKKPLPSFPLRIGVITSPTGAAVRDIINVTGRRFPLADVFVYPALVQGEAAAPSLIEALDYLDSSSLVDVIIIGRGGGSIEDLWAFNDETLARRIFSAKTPIISAVGHETDFTICDFVADRRAPTPSAAAELAVPDVRELLQRVDSYDERLLASVNNILSSKSEKLAYLTERSSADRMLEHLSDMKESVSLLLKNSSSAADNLLDKLRARFTVLCEKTNALSPLSVLSRGYSLAEKDGKLLKSTSDVSAGDRVIVRLSDGEITAVAERVKKIDNR